MFGIHLAHLPALRVRALLLRCLPRGADMATAAGELLASFIPPWLRRSWLRRLYDQPGAAFDLDFTDRGAAQIVFDEGQGSLLTDGTRACMEKSHILYDQELDSAGTLPAGARGLLLKMDNTGITCGHDAQIAVGHLASWSGCGCAPLTMAIARCLY